MQDKTHGRVVDQIREYEQELRDEISNTNYNDTGAKDRFAMSNADFLRESGISATSIGSKSVDRSMQLAQTNDRLAKLEKMYKELALLEEKAKVT